MRSLKRGARPLVLILVLALTLMLSASAASFDMFPDAFGHWAEPYLRRAVEERLLTGYDNGLLMPDEPATMPQALTILRRMLWPTSAVTAGEMNMPGGKWYSDDAAAARAMGIDFDVSELEGGVFTRGRAFDLLGQAFRLIPAEPDYSVLGVFSDSGELSDRDRPAAAAMVAAGYINGDDLGRLNPNDPISRAELVAVLLRVAERTLSRVPGESSGGTVLTDAAGLSGGRYEGSLWLTRDAGDVDLSGVTAGTVVVLSGDAAITVDSKTNIQRLVIAGGKGETLELAPGRVGALVIAAGAPESVTVRGGVDAIEITGSGHRVTVCSASSRLTVSGAENAVTLSSGSMEEVVVTPRASGNTVTSQIPLSRVRLEGASNTVTLSSNCASASVGGDSCALEGGVAVGELTVSSRSARVQVSGNPVYTYPTGAGVLGLALTVPTSFSATAPIHLTATATGYEDAVCTLVWTLDGQAVRTDSVTVRTGDNTFVCDMPIGLYQGMPASRLIGVTLTYPDGTTASQEGSTALADPDRALSAVSITLTPQDHTQTAHVKASATLTNPVGIDCVASWYVDGGLLATENVSIGPAPVTITLDRDLGYTPSAMEGSMELHLTFGSLTASAAAPCKLTHITAEQALASVTSSYAGDFTLEWALANDYDPVTKTVWVNAKGYESDSQYLIWVNRTYQRVNVFQGSQGNWTLIHTFLCGTGRPGHATPVSVSKVRSHRPQGWRFPTYIVKPVVYFYKGGYAFHSRLWNKSHTKLVDDSIGFPVSKGCVRMYDEDVQWIYDNIPDGTTVVVH